MSLKEEGNIKIQKNKYNVTFNIIKCGYKIT